MEQKIVCKNYLIQASNFKIQQLVFINPINKDYLVHPKMLFV